MMDCNSVILVCQPMLKFGGTDKRLVPEKKGKIIILKTFNRLVPVDAENLGVLKSWHDTS